MNLDKNIPNSKPSNVPISRPNNIPISRPNNIPISRPKIAVSRPKIAVSRPKIAVSNPLSDEQKEKLNKTRQEAAKRINQGTSFIDSNLLSKFKNKNFNGGKIKKLNEQFSILDKIKNIVSEMFDYFMEYMPEFSIKLGVMLIVVIVYFSLGGAMLYLCKISQTNFLPVFSTCYPYSDTQVELKDITTNIFQRTLNDENISMNLNFKFEDNNKYVLLDAIRKYKTSNKSNVIIVYLLSIVNALFNFNYNFINLIFGNLNNLNETLVIILSPLIYILSFVFLFFSNNLYFAFLWFYKMTWFFKMNKNCSKKKKKAKWVPVEMFQNPMQFYIGCILTFIACMLSIGVIISLFFNPIFSIPSITMVYSMISSMIFKGTIKEKSVNVFSIIGNVFKYNKLLMFVMVSFFTIFRSNISEKIFKLYENYNKKQTSILAKFGENMMKINKDINKMNDFSNKMDVLNLRDRVDVIGIDKTMDENTRKLQNQINTLNEKNRKLTNTQEKIADKFEDAYNVNTPFTVVVLCILFAIISSLGMFKVSDYNLFSPVVDFETNDVECEGDEDGEDGEEHSAIYNTYMIGKSLWNAYKNAVVEKQEEVNEDLDPATEASREFYGALKDESLQEYERAVEKNPRPEKGASTDSATTDDGKAPDGKAPDGKAKAPDAKAKDKPKK